MTTSSPRFVGIDFSGDQKQWNPNAKASNIWIAEVEQRGDYLTVVDLRRVQQLAGHVRPFARLAAWLANGSFSAAAIDAPFSVPWWFFGHVFADHPALLQVVNGLPLVNKQDFPTGNAFVTSVSARIPFEFTKPLRITESYWRARSVNVRSTVWSGQRPGASFTSACIKLLANADRQAWPWHGPSTCPLVEAYPAAQLRHWGLPFQQYNGTAGQRNRVAIIHDLTVNRALQVDNAYLDIMNADADALDAVISTYAARAVTQNHLSLALPPFNS